MYFTSGNDFGMAARHTLAELAVVDMFALDLNIA
jgi:hypothetical protein